MDEIIWFAGTQVLYIPQHVDLEDRFHSDVEAGFLSHNLYPEDEYVFCRYWNKPPWERTLRTRANSEKAPVGRLVPVDTVPQGVVEAWLTIIAYESGT